EPTPNTVVKSTVAAVVGPPAATTSVRETVPSTVHTTTSGSPSESATFTETVAAAPPGGAQSKVIGLGQLTLGAVLPLSYAPMSIIPPTIRAKPRWSVSGALVLSPALRAGLPQSRAWVNVGPPLSCSGPSLSAAALRLN